MADSTDGQENGLNMRGAEFAKGSSLTINSPSNTVLDLRQQVKKLKTEKEATHSRTTQLLNYLTNLIEEFEDQVETLKKRLKKVNKELVRYREHDNRRNHYDNDYLPYEEDYRE